MRYLSKTNRIVIKIGTSSLVCADGTINTANIKEYVAVISKLQNEGKEVVLVSSGAIGAGLSKLCYKRHEMSNIEKQVAATVGQCLVMRAYTNLFEEHNHIVSQVLISKYMIDAEKRTENLKNVFETFLQKKVVPIVNENDALMLHELEFKNNDTLSAYISNLIHADLLIILTDVDGVFDKNPNQYSDAKLISNITEITDEIKIGLCGASHNFGVGGMITKLVAAEIAAKSNTKTLILNSNKAQLICDALQNEEVGTYINLNN